jgi:hypothetical protein
VAIFVRTVVGRDADLVAEGNPERHGGDSALSMRQDCSRCCGELEMTFAGESCYWLISKPDRARWIKHQLAGDLIDPSKYIANSPKLNL